MIHDFPLWCSSQLGTQTHLIQHKSYQIHISFSLRENLFIQPLHQNEQISETDPCLIPFDSLRLISFPLMLLTGVGTQGESHLCIGKCCGQLIWSGASMIFGVPHIILIYVEQYQRSLFHFSPLLSTLSHSQIESRTSLL